MRGRERERERDVINERREVEKILSLSFHGKSASTNNGPKEICRQEVFQICVKC